MAGWWSTDPRCWVSRRSWAIAAYFAASLLILSGCKFEPQIDPLTFPTVPPQPFSQFQPSEANPAELVLTELPTAQPFESPESIEPRGSVGSWALGIGGGVLAAAGAAGLVNSLRASAGSGSNGFGRGAGSGQFRQVRYRPRLRRALWAAPIAAGLLGVASAARSCAVPDICYATVGGVKIAVVCEEAQAEPKTEATATPACSEEQESQYRDTVENIARSTDNRLTDHLTLEDLQAARQAFLTGVDPAGRAHLQEVLEAAKGQLDDVRRMRSLQDHITITGGCSSTLMDRLRGVLRRADNVIQRVTDHFPEWRDAYQAVYGTGP